MRRSSSVVCPYAAHCDRPLHTPQLKAALAKKGTRSSNTPAFCCKRQYIHRPRPLSCKELHALAWCSAGSLSQIVRFSGVAAVYTRTTPRGLEKGRRVPRRFSSTRADTRRMADGQDEVSAALCCALSGSMLVLQRSARGSCTDEDATLPRLQRLASGQRPSAVASAGQSLQGLCPWSRVYGLVVTNRLLPFL